MADREQLLTTANKAREESPEWVNVVCACPWTLLLATPSNARCVMPEMIKQGTALKSARKRKDWSQSRLAAALEQSARALGRGKDLPPGGRQTLVQYISYFENGKREVPDRLKPIFRETFQAQCHSA
jgi:hypothetical protein